MPKLVGFFDSCLAEKASGWSEPNVRFNLGAERLKLPIKPAEMEWKCN
jgi:hypothetical protein